MEKRERERERERETRERDERETRERERRERERERERDGEEKTQKRREERKEGGRKRERERERERERAENQCIRILSENKASSQDEHERQTTTGIAIEHRLVSLGMLFSRTRRTGDLCSISWEPDGSRQLFGASSKLRDHSLTLQPERVIWKPPAHKIFEVRNRRTTMQINMIAVDREDKISPAKGSKVRHFYPLQLTTRRRRQTKIPFYTLTRWKSKRNFFWRAQSQHARREFSLTSSRAGVAIQLHIASLVTTGNALRETRLLLLEQRRFGLGCPFKFDLIKAGATQTEMSLLKQYVAGWCVDLLDAPREWSLGSEVTS